MTDIDEAIQKIEHLYRGLTGKDLPPTDTPYSPIPPEKGAERHVEEQLDRLLGMLGGLQGNAEPAAAPQGMPMYGMPHSSAPQPGVHPQAAPQPGMPLASQVPSQPQTMTPLGAPWMPLLSIAESPNEILIHVDLAGVSRDAVEVNVTQNLLTVAGQRALPDANGGTGARLRMSERPIGAFRRVVVLPPGTAADGLSAHMRDGVLEIRVPRMQPGTDSPRSVSVQ